MSLAAFSILVEVLMLNQRDGMTTIMYSGGRLLGDEVKNY